MRFESVTAHAFGPFVNRSLQLAEGLTVVFGLNEAGKSSWHAAIYAALCGMQRGKRPSNEDAAFRDRHRPWDSTAWDVSTIVALEDGRRIEIRQDLERRVDCRATDADLGRDCSAEIMYRGAPDGSRWLDLNRDSFPAVACVRQADLLAVAESPKLLQEHLQRAAATSGTDATAAEALRRLSDFHANNVGLDRANATKPLRQALNRVQSARAALDQARSDHDEYLALQAQAEERSVAEEAAGRRVRQAEAAQAANQAAEWERRLDRVKQLAARFPDGAPSSARDDDVLAQDAAAALQAWEKRPRVPALTGATAAELRQELELLPPMPDGEQEPHPAVVAARKTFADAQRGLELHRGTRPADPFAPDPSGASEDELRDLARELAAPQPEIDPILEKRLEEARRRVADSSKKQTNKGAVIGAGVAAVVGVIALALGLLPIGLPLLLVGGAAMVWLLTRSNDGERVQALQELRKVEASAAGQQHAATEAKRRREEAMARIAALDLPADPEALRQRAGLLAAAAQAARELERWERQQATLDSRLDAARAELTATLRGRGVEVCGDVDAAFASYEAACQARARQAAQAAQRDGLTAQLARQEALETAAAQAAEQRRQAEARLREVAARIGLNASPDEELVRGIQEWQRNRAAALTEQDTARREWAELQSLLAGRGLHDVEEETARRRSAAERLAEGVDHGALAAMQEEPDLRGLLDQLREEHNRAVSAAAAVRGQVAERVGRVPSVSEQEEALAAAESELERVRRLDQTLKKTQEYLERAQQRVHRDIAPVLAKSVRAWLPEVTSGRYTDVRVDPQTLKVQVLGPDDRWRDAGLLSRGTAEQVYLLLRVALAEHLTRDGEVCPLVLDDVTVQCDGERTEAVLKALHAISQQRQVIIFSQESAVRTWAEANLREPRDRLVTLERPRTTATAAA